MCSRRPAATLANRIEDVEEESTENFAENLPEKLPKLAEYEISKQRKRWTRAGNESLSAEEVGDGRCLQIGGRLEACCLDQLGKRPTVSRIKKRIQRTSVDRHVEDRAQHSHQIAGVMRSDAHERTALAQRAAIAKRER